ncbi:MAG: trypsin-like peptidase domain-containing protein [Patescibacteria group bacterium]
MTSRFRRRDYKIVRHRAGATALTEANAQVLNIKPKLKSIPNMENITNREQEIPKQDSVKSASKSIFTTAIILSILLSSFFGAVFGFMGGKISIGKKTDQSNQAVNQNITEEESTVIETVNKSTPAVVSIVISKDVPKYRSFFQDPFGFFNDLEENQSSGTEKQTVGAGSGFLVNQNGLVATNKHVVSDANADYTVIANDGKEYPAKVLARDPVKDIAIIKVEGNNFPTLSFGDSNNLKVGQTVIAIGNSLGEFYNTVSKGIISGLSRNLTAGSGLGQTEQLSNIIQTDAAINPGNSGGPLLDISGNVIGINVAIAQGAQNIGFAIPSNQIKKIVDQVNATGKISTPYLGVRSVIIDKQIQSDNNLPFGYGALVLRGSKPTDLAVMPNSPADKAGIVENDIILEVNGTKVNDSNQLSDLIANYNVGDTITLKVWHKGSTNDVKATLEEIK